MKPERLIYPIPGCGIAARTEVILMIALVISNFRSSGTPSRLTISVICVPGSPLILLTALSRVRFTAEVSSIWTITSFASIPAFVAGVPFIGDMTVISPLSFIPTTMPRPPKFPPVDCSKSSKSFGVKR